MVRILVADDHDVMRRGLRDMLAEHKGWKVCAEAQNGLDAVDLTVQLRPDVAVLDIDMPVLSGLEAARHIRKQSPDTQILMYTVYDSDPLRQEARNIGAQGYILKADASMHLIEAVEALARHEPFFSPRPSTTTPDTLLGAEEQARDGSASGVLTAREREIVRLLAQGKSSKEAATILYISRHTVETHRATIMRKLHITSVVELVHYAVRTKLITL